MNQEDLKKCLEDALGKVVPQNSGCRTVTGWDQKRFVACNRMGYRGAPKMVYKLEKFGSGVQLSFLISSRDPRVQMLEALFAQNQVGVSAYAVERDFCVHSGEICATVVAEMVKKFYDAYEMNLCR